MASSRPSCPKQTFPSALPAAADLKPTQSMKRVVNIRLASTRAPFEAPVAPVTKETYLQKTRACVPACVLNEASLSDQKDLKDARLE